MFTCRDFVVYSMLRACMNMGENLSSTYKFFTLCLHHRLARSEHDNVRFDGIQRQLRFST